MIDPILTIVDFSMSVNDNLLLRDVDMMIHPGEIVGLLGRSGSGKSLLAKSLLGLAPDAVKTRGAVRFATTDLGAADEETLSGKRGSDIALIFQEPMTALNPVQTIGRQIGEAVRLHRDADDIQLAADVERAMMQAGLDPLAIPPTRYPHELSGGQRQRVLIAMAIVNRPRLLIADEPTTALDSLSQAAVLATLQALASDNEMAVLFITHDRAAMARIADRVYAVEGGTVIELNSAFAGQQCVAPVERSNAKQSTAIAASNITAVYANGGGVFRRSSNAHAAVDNVSFEVAAGDITAIVGPSGCGKSTLARCLAGLQPRAAGDVTLGGTTAPRSGRWPADLRRRVQVVFQDPAGSFNPQLAIGASIAEPLGLIDRSMRRDERQSRVAAMLRAVGLGDIDPQRRPHALSGGQRQRAALARALIAEPDVIILDEATSALDTIARDTVLDLVRRLAQERGTAFLLITHDLALASAVSSHIMVMEHGRIVERGPAETIVGAPQHPLTRALLSAADLYDNAAEQNGSDEKPE